MKGNVDSEIVKRFKAGRMENLEGLIFMANYLITRNYNGINDPFKFSLKKLIQVYNMNKIMDFEKHNMELQGNIAAIGTFFGDKEAMYVFDNIIKNLKDK